MNIETSSPTRVDLAGGTLDCWPLHLFVGDCVTINLSIDVMTSVTLSGRTDNSIAYKSPDMKYQRDFSCLADLLQCEDSSLSLVRETIRHFKPTMGFDLTTKSQSPVGGGLGASSSLCVSLIKAFLQLNNKSLPLDKMVQLASNIEAKVLKTPTGTQDYFPAIVPGLNFIHYTVEGPNCVTFEGSIDYFTDRILMVNTGKAHHSGINNWQVIQSAVAGNLATLGHLKELAKIAAKMHAAIITNEMDEIVSLFHEEYEFRTQLCHSFTSPLIEEVKSAALGAGAKAIKICGAGGGGCVLVLVDPPQRSAVKLACEGAGFEVLTARPFLSKG